jgi:hypothetical protein
MVKADAGDDEAGIRRDAWIATERWADESEPRATGAHYQAANRTVTIDLRNGCAFTFPVSRYPQLAAGTTDQLAAIEIDPDGDGLIWDALAFSLSVPGLIMEAIGGQALWQHWGEQWQRRLDHEIKRLRSEQARKGGLTKSPARAEAARQNGKKGGRPPKERSA